MINIAEATNEEDFEMLKRKGATDKSIFCFVSMGDAKAVEFARKAFTGLMLLDVGSGIVMERSHDPASPREPAIMGFFV